MIVLGVDAGITTGLAIVSGDDQRVLHLETAQPDALQDKLVLMERTVDKVVVEKALPYKRSKLGQQLQAVHLLIHDVCPNAVWIDASQWKNTEVKYSPVPRGVTAHERDAIRIARWYLIQVTALLDA
jgi:hypothetical protein